jgi:hypothetical protein
MSLCISIISIIIISIIYIGFVLYELEKNIDEDGNIKLTPNNLRDMYTEKIITDRYNKIYDSIIQKASAGKTQSDFTIMCIRKDDSICDNYNGYDVWWRQYISRNGGEIILKNDIRHKQIKIRILQKLQSSFPNSIIIKNYTNCCIQYSIIWQ